ncbi:MAG: hypothetical protein KAJ55_01175 [Anaerolineales bacterium]|jgi:hypothetical protein|nr:hypothetical protein [Anaerolineales bacterium]
MDNVKEMITRKSFAVGAALIAGIALGVLYAWVIQPVQLVDADISQLREDLRVDYLRMVIGSYATDSDAEVAIQRYESLGENKDATLSEVGESPGEVGPSDLQKFQALVAVESPSEAPLAETTETDEATASTEPTTASTETTSASRYILPVCLGTLALGAMLGIALVLRRRIEARENDFESDFTPNAIDDAHDVDLEAEMEIPSDGPLATFRTTYTIGDDLYDDSFSVESPASGDFLGECGVGIAEAIGVGDPKKVSAFEVWLFDKNDIQTVTKIIMSKYTFSDEETRSQLAAKGDPVMAEGGEVVELETASLRVEARIVDMSYGEGALPKESFFDRMTIELKAIAKT